MMMRKGRTGLVALALFAGACGSPTDVELCLEGGGTALAAGGCMDMSRLAGLVPELRSAIADAVAATVEQVDRLMPLPPVRVEVNADPVLVIPEIGVGGRAPDAHHVFLAVDTARPDRDSLPGVAVPAILAHELHHTARHAGPGYGGTLLEAAVSEGLADHFAQEMYGGPPPPWSTALAGAELAAWTDSLLASASGPYDHPAWFFGVGGQVPRWTAYSVGYELVRRFMEAHPGRRASDLVAEPASSFVPR